MLNINVHSLVMQFADKRWLKSRNWNFDMKPYQLEICVDSVHVWNYSLEQFGKINLVNSPHHEEKIPISTKYQVFLKGNHSHSVSIALYKECTKLFLKRNENMFEGMITFSLNDLYPDASNSKGVVLDKVLSLAPSTSSNRNASTSSPLNACNVHFTLSLNETSATTKSLRNKKHTSMEMHTIEGYSFKLPSNFHMLEHCVTVSGCSHSFEVISKKDVSLEYDIFNVMIVNEDSRIVELKREMDEDSNGCCKNIARSKDIQNQISNECLSDRSKIDKWTFTSKEGLQMFISMASFRIDPRKSDRICIIEYRKRLNATSDISQLGYKIENLVIDIINSISGSY